MNAVAHPIPLHAERSVTFKAWRIPDDGQKRTRSFGVKLPIEGPRYPANTFETHAQRTGRLYAAPGYQLDVSGADTLREALDLASPACSHKDHLTILEHDAGRGTQRQHVYAIKQDGAPKYRGPLGTERYYELYAFHLFDLDMRAFDPIPPFDAMRATHAEIVGVDSTLVEGR